MESHPIRELKKKKNVSTQLLCRNKVSVENSEPEKGSVLKTGILKSEL
jgi:hypothetical protein